MDGPWQQLKPPAGGRGPGSSVQGQAEGGGTLAAEGSMGWGAGAAGRALAVGAWGEEKGQVPRGGGVNDCRGNVPSQDHILCCWAS